MESPRSPSGSVRRHGRNISQPLMRRTTRGPLEGEDPLADRTEHQSILSPSDHASPAASTSPHLPEPALPVLSNIKLNLDFLQDPKAYHVLPSDDIHPAFLVSERQPPPDTPLGELLQQGHYRRAADIAVKDLMKCPSADVEHVLQLLYTRLACLVLVSRPDLAAQEAVPLAEALARAPSDAGDLLSLVPWELRLLMVRLQALGTTDGGRRSIMSLYGLASEARSRVRQATKDENETSRQVWASRLRDLGLRVADTLVEMGELETASRHLQSLTDSDPEQVTYRKALLRMKVGDVMGARRAVERVKDDKVKRALSLIVAMADGDHRNASMKLRRDLEKDGNRADLANNLAISIMYTGHITEARRVLEQLMTEQPAFVSSLFNLSTIYELCTERAVDLKNSLAERLAAKSANSEAGGWERTHFDLKL